MARLNEATITKTMAAADTVVLTQTDGKIARISKADLVEAIRAVMPVATTTSNGLMSAGNVRALDAVSFCKTVGVITWVNVGEFTKDFYNPIRVMADLGAWSATTRAKYDVTITCSAGNFYIAGNSGNRVGYVPNNTATSFAVYIKAASGESVICSCLGAKSLSARLDTTTEPAGIIYIP